MKKSLIVLLAVAAMSIFAGTSVSEKDKLAEELVNLAGISQNVQNAKKSIMQMNDRMFSRMQSGSDAKKMAAYRQKIDKLVNDSFDWNKLKGDYVKLYAKTFTTDEMKGIIEFYKTPAGKLFRERENLMRQEMKLMQNQYRQIMPQLRKMQMELRSKNATRKKRNFRKPTIRKPTVKKTECSKDKATCNKATAPAVKAEEAKK